MVNETLVASRPGILDYAASQPCPYCVTSCFRDKGAFPAHFPRVTNILFHVCIVCYSPIRCQWTLAWFLVVYYCNPFCSEGCCRQFCKPCTAHRMQYAPGASHVCIMAEFLHVAVGPLLTPVRGGGAIVCTWRSRNGCWESALFFHCELQNSNSVIQPVLAIR